MAASGLSYHILPGSKFGSSRGGRSAEHFVSDGRDTMFCPECRAEYPKNIITCVRCNVPLVDDLRATAPLTSSPPHFWVGCVFAAVLLGSGKWDGSDIGEAESGT